MNQRMFINSYRMLSKLSTFRSQPKNSSHKCNFSDKPVKVEQVAPPLEQQSPKELLRNVVFPSAFDKKLLVWAGRYKSVEDVPKKVTYEELYHSKNKCRIKAANGLMIATVIGCLVAIYLGKQARARGDTVQKMNIDWHKEINRKMDEEEERKNHQSK